MSGNGDSSNLDTNKNFNDAQSWYVNAGTGRNGEDSDNAIGIVGSTNSAINKNMAIASDITNDIGDVSATVVLVAT